MIAVIALDMCCIKKRKLTIAASVIVEVLAGECLACLLHLSQHHRCDLLWGEGLLRTLDISNLDVCKDHFSRSFY